MTQASTSNTTARAIALAESLIVATVWASSFVFIKIGLRYMGPLTLAGLRYFSAFLILLPFLLRRKAKARKVSCSHEGRLLRYWGRLAATGVSAYTIGNAALFWGLKYLPATTGSFLLTLVPLLMLPVSVVWLKEIPARHQLIGIAIALVGSVIFFGPGLRIGESLGVAIVGGGLLGFTAFGILGREIAKTGEVDTLTLTAIPLGIGGGMLLLIAILVEGWPIISIEGWGVVLLLAIVNTALAYSLYNHALKVMTAVEMNIILNLCPLGTAILAWALLDETLAAIQFVGMVVVIVGVVLVQRQSS